MQLISLVHTAVVVKSHYSCMSVFAVKPPYCQTLTFGDYRRPSLLERCVLTLAAIGPVGWKAFTAFRSARRTLSKALVVLLAPGIAWIVRSVIAYFYR